MIYTNNTKKAMKIAYQAHNGQLDKSGIPYIYHPIHIAETMDTEEECIVALLHDVIEDTPITISELEKYFQENIITALKILSHNKEKDYMEYIKTIKNNSLAKKIKLADLKHNSDLTRLNVITEKDKERKEKYEKAIKLLLE